MRKLSYSIFFFITAFLFIPNIFALDTSLKIYDDADLLTSEEETQLKVKIDAFIDKYNMDMVIVTTNDNSSSGTTQDYAQDFYDYNGFGIGKTKDGILLLIDRTYGYNDLRIVTTGEAILIYDDIRIEYILDDIVYAKSDGYYQMALAFIDASSSYAEKGVAPSNSGYYIDVNGILKPKRFFPWFWVILISLAVPSIIVGVLVARNKMIKKEVQAAAYLDQNSIEYTRREDRFITTHTSSAYIPRDTGGSGGGRSRGSSTFSSHSGTRHGGGGRRC